MIRPPDPVFLREVRSRSKRHDLLGITEQLLAIVPSPRVTAEEYIRQLRLNGIEGRILGQGSARVVDHDGRRFRVDGVVVGSVAASDTEKAEKIAQLCGITATRLDRK